MSDESDSAESTGIRIVDNAQLRISKVTVEMTPDGPKIVGQPEVEVRADVWQHWLFIAHEQSQRAAAARQRNPGFDSETLWVAAMQDELRASMTAVSAAAFALEAFRDTVTQIVPSSDIEADSAAGRVSSALLHAFRFPNDKAKALRNDLGQVFAIRNAAVHPSSAFAPPALHPALGIAVEPKYVNFRTENAAACVQIARAVIGGCIAAPRSRFPELVAWCAGAGELLGPAPLAP